MKKRLMAKIISAVMIVSFIMVNGGIQPIVAMAEVASEASTTYSCEVDGIVWDYEVDTVGNAINVAPKEESLVEGSVTIPNTLDGKKVTCIGYSAFSNRTRLTSITIPEGIERIKNYAFYSCVSLISINIPKELTSISEHAFYNCANLEEFIVAEDNTEYASVDGVLYNKEKTEIINYPTNKYGENYNILDSVTKIGPEAFYNCKNLLSIIIPKGVTSIEKSAFCGCKGLSSIILPEGLTIIKDSVLNSCSNLEYIDIPEGVISIEGYAFAGCSDLKGINIPEKVTSLESRTFYGCTYLERVSIPDSITSISEEAFKGCTYLKTIFANSGSFASTFNWEYGKVNTEVGYTEGSLLIEKDLEPGQYSYKIHGINWIYEVDSMGNAINVEPREKNEMRGYFGTITEVTIPGILDGKKVISIKERAFDLCWNLTSVSIPDSVTSIGQSAFGWCTSLEYINIPKGVTKIEDSLFWDCESLKSISIPEGVTSIGRDSFRNCESLISINFPEGLTRIGIDAFYDCTILKSVSIPDSTTSISEDAFEGCTNLETIYANYGSFASKYVWKYGKVDTNIGYISESTIENIKANAVASIEYANKALLSYRTAGGLETDTVYQNLKNAINIYASNESLESETDISKLTKWNYDLDGLITAIDTEIQNKVLDIRFFDTSVYSPQSAGTSIKIYTFSSGGKGELQTKFTLIDGTAGTILRNYSTEESFVWTPTKAGTYIIKATVKDSTGKEVTKSLTYEIKKELEINKFTASVDSPQVVGTGIKLSTTSSGGVGTLQTMFTITEGTNWSVLKDYSTEDKAVWTPTEAGIYTIKALVKDSTGIYVEKELTYVVYDPVNLNSVTIDQGSSIDLGKSVNIITDAVGGNGKLSYSISAENNGTIEKISDLSQSPTATWTPTKTGVWNITATVVDENGNESEKQVTLEVKDIAKNETTIYYKGYSTPYIHYKVGTGNWTLVPGVAMTPTTEMVGYTHKITVDLGTASTLIACFNNGYGSWDSRNGANYTFNAGTYDYSNGTITKVQEPVKTLTINSFTSSIEGKVAIGKSVVLNGNATSDASTIEYKLSVINSKNETTVIKDYSTSNTASWTPSVAGDYTLVLDVRDSNGNTATTQIKLQGYDVTSNLTTIYYKGYTTPYIHYRVGTGSWTLAPGVAMTPTTEMLGYTHKITIDLGTASTLIACFNNGSGSWDSKNGANYTFNAGTYDYSNGTITKVQEPVKTLTINGFTSNIIGKLNVGTSVILAGIATSDASTIEYKMSVINPKNETKVIKEYSTSNIGTWTPSEAGEFTLVLEAKDSNGKTARTEMKVQAYVVSSHITTIYYKGYTTPYIHYKVGTGSWTSAPGIAMTPTSEKAGYTHKIVIDLGDVDTLTACFNNGSGSWDSKNGANYTFNSGTYTYSNGNNILMNN